MSINKLIATVSLAVIVITLRTSNQLSIYASPTTEDDGYTYPDDSSDEEKEEIDEQEQEAWEDAGRPGDRNDDDDEKDKDYLFLILTCVCLYYQTFSANFVDSAITPVQDYY